MRLRLKEDPREWRKFSWALAGALVLATALLVWRQHAVGTGTTVLGVLALGVLATGTLRPRWYRPVYRVAMTGAHYAGQVFGRVLLAVVFLVLVTPLGLLLRALGKDLLHLQEPNPQPDGEHVSYWHPTRPPGPLDRMF